MFLMSFNRLATHLNIDYFFKRLIVICIFFFLSACSQTSIVSQNQISSEKLSEAFAVKHTGFEATEIKHPKIFENNSDLKFNTLNFSDVTIDTVRLDIGERDWEFTEKERASLIKYFEDQSSNIFATNTKPKFIAELKILSFAPNANKDNGTNRGTRDRVFTRSVGTMSMEISIRDATSGELVAYIRDKDEVGDQPRLQLNDRINNLRHYKLTLKKWLKDLHDVVEDLS